LDFTNCILPPAFFDDTLSPSEITDSIVKMKQQKKIMDEYRDKIKLRKDGRQYYVIINRKQVTASTLDALYEKLWELHYGYQNASLAELFPQWLIWKRDNTPVSAKTLKEYTFLWNSVFQGKSLVDRPLRTLTSKDFICFFRLLTKNRQLTKSRFTNIKSLLNGVYSFAIEQEIVTHNPIRDIDCRQFYFKPVNHSNDAFTVDERTALLAYLENINTIYSLAIQLDFCLVLRIGELLSLEWTDIEDNCIHVQRQHLMDMTMNDDLSFSSRSSVNVDHIKGNTDCGFRYQPLIPKAFDILAKIRLLNPNGRYILMQDGKQLLADTFNEQLKKYCLEAGVVPRSSHKIRFTNASILYNQGMPLANLQKLLGHTTTAMTLHYIRSVTPSETTADIMLSSLG
jgi:integrase